jgi:hypothetical protein
VRNSIHYPQESALREGFAIEAKCASELGHDSSYRLVDLVDVNYASSSRRA